MKGVPARGVHTPKGPKTAHSPKKQRAGTLSSRDPPCPSFPWSFRPQKYQGFFSPCEPSKTLQNKQKTLKKTREISRQKNTKETKTPRKRRTQLLPLPLSKEARREGGGGWSRLEGGGSRLEGGRGPGSKVGRGVYMDKMGSICYFPRALPASIWGHPALKSEFLLAFGAHWV